jgi:hypothetical protein
MLYGDDFNLLGNSINTILENTQILFEASKDISLKINAGMTKYMIISRHQNSGEDQNIRVSNESFENMAKLNYLGTT